MPGKLLAMGWLLALTLVLGGPAAAAEEGGPPDRVAYGPWAELLAAHVRGGLVDYAGFQKESAKLGRFLSELDRAEPEDLDRRAQKALWINAYNAYTVKLILTKYPDLESIKDLGGLFSSPWSREIVHVGGRVYSLDQVEHDVLRPRFADPRVHFAINCASLGCPPLLDRPYLPVELDRQLDQVTTAFLNDPKRTWLDGNRLHVSRIFKWFGEDFGDDPAGFVRKYARGEFKARLDRLAREGKLEVEYQDYDWSLNVLPGSGPKP